MQKNFFFEIVQTGLVMGVFWTMTIQKITPKSALLSLTTLQYLGKKDKNVIQGNLLDFPCVIHHMHERICVFNLGFI